MFNLIPREIISLILSFLPYNFNYFLVSKLWKECYYKAISIYPIPVYLNSNARNIKACCFLIIRYHSYNMMVDLEEIKKIRFLKLNYPAILTGIKIENFINLEYLDVSEIYLDIDIQFSKKFYPLKTLIVSYRKVPRDLSKFPNLIKYEIR